MTVNRLQQMAEAVYELSHFMKFNNPESDLLKLKQALEPFIKPELDIESATTAINDDDDLFDIDEVLRHVRIRAILSRYFTQSQGVDVEALAESLDGRAKLSRIHNDNKSLKGIFADRIRHHFVDIGPIKEDVRRIKLIADGLSLDKEELKVRIAELEKLLEKHVKLIHSSAVAKPNEPVSVLAHYAPIVSVEMFLELKSALKQGKNKND